MTGTDGPGAEAEDTSFVELVASTFEAVDFGPENAPSEEVWLADLATIRLALHLFRFDDKALAAKIAASANDTDAFLNMFQQVNACATRIKAAEAILDGAFQRLVATLPRSPHRERVTAERRAWARDDAINDGPFVRNAVVEMPAPGGVGPPRLGIYSVHPNHRG
jgi:hypothetical protein